MSYEVERNSPYAAIDEVSPGYCLVNPSASSTIEKVDEILQRVRRIDNILKTTVDVSLKDSKVKPAVPPKPMRSKSTTALPPGLASAAPPRPPKTEPARSRCESGTAHKTFTKTECEFLTLQLQSVRSILDEMIDDDFSEKDKGMAALDSVIKAIQP
ncbi:uncharacterized protein LOC100186212 [Ciona intestinalis]